MGQYYSYIFQSLLVYTRIQYNKYHNMGKIQIWKNITVDKTCNKFQNLYVHVHND